MTAGTVVITGGILATVILLCIIVVLCYCRLQYYCCKKNGSDPDSSSCSQAQLACDSCSPPRLDGAGVAPLSLSARSFCPTCSPYGSSYYIRATDETRNGAERIGAERIGAERIGYMPGQHESPSLSLTLPSTHSTSLSSHTLPDFYYNTHTISTDV